MINEMKLMDMTSARMALAIFKRSAWVSGLCPGPPHRMSWCRPIACTCVMAAWMAMPMKGATEASGMPTMFLTPCNLREFV